MAKDRALTVGEVLKFSKDSDNFAIINECNELLIEIADANRFVAPVAKMLSPELLERQVVNFGMDSENRLVIFVKGMEDAE